jgi:hypothetical protein
MIGLHLGLPRVVIGLGRRHNVGGRDSARRPKRLRFLLLNTVGKVVRHARETLLRCCKDLTRRLAGNPLRPQPPRVSRGLRRAPPMVGLRFIRQHILARARRPFVLADITSGKSDSPCHVRDQDPLGPGAARGRCCARLRLGRDRMDSVAAGLPGAAWATVVRIPRLASIPAAGLLLVVVHL